MQGNALWQVKPPNDYFFNVSGSKSIISKCEYEKDLGVVFDQLLTFDKHIQNSISRSSKLQGNIKRSFISRDKDIILKQI